MGSKASEGAKVMIFAFAVLDFQHAFVCESSIIPMHSLFDRLSSDTYL